MIRKYLLPGLLMLALGWNAGLAVSYAYSQQQQDFGPSWGVAYATNGREVQVTNLNGGGLFYPGPTEARVVQVDGGFDVYLHTSFRQIGTAAYLPVVVK